MDVEGARGLLLRLPHVCETMQWGDNLVFWVGDKAIGGKMFALIGLDSQHQHAMSFAAGPVRASELLELEGVRPAPYLARAHWVAVERWKVLTNHEWALTLEGAHAYVRDRLPAGTRKALALPPGELAGLVAARRRELEAGDKKASGVRKKAARLSL